MAFTGRATYDNTTALAEDVSDIVSMISPFETPLLDFLGDAARPATNTLHEWLEESLGPPSIIASTAINRAYHSLGNDKKLLVVQVDFPDPDGPIMATTSP